MSTAPTRNNSPNWRQPTTIRNSRNGLQVPQHYGIITVYLKHGNGGYNVNARVPNSRGGSTKTEGVSRYGLETYQEETACSSQDQRSVADNARRLPEVSGLHQEHSTRSGKLNYFAFSVAQRDCPLIGTHQAKPAVRRYLMLIIATNHHALQWFTTYCHVAMGYEVAVWRESMTTTSHRIELFNADGSHIGNISEMALSALIDSGLLDREDTPAENLAPIHGPCIECDHPRAFGIFCRCCFLHLRTCDAKWAAAWYGLDWDEACQQASLEEAEMAAQEVQG